MPVSLFLSKVMWGTTTMARAIPWSPTGSAWHTTSCSTMDCTGKWRSMWVGSLDTTVKFHCGILSFNHVKLHHILKSGEKASSLPFASVSSGHTKPVVKRWQNTTAMTTSSSWGPSDQTTCLSTANRCRDVSVHFSSNRCSSVLPAGLTFNDAVPDLRCRATYALSHEELYCVQFDL